MKVIMNHEWIVSVCHSVKGRENTLLFPLSGHLSQPNSLILLASVSVTRITFRMFSSPCHKSAKSVFQCAALDRMDRWAIYWKINGLLIVAFLQATCSPHTPFLLISGVVRGRGYFL